MVRKEEQELVMEKAAEIAEERTLDILLPARKAPRPGRAGGGRPFVEKMRSRLKAGQLKDRPVELEVPDRALPMIEIFSASGMEEDGHAC